MFNYSKCFRCDKNNIYECVCNANIIYCYRYFVFYCYHEIQSSKYLSPVFVIVYLWNKCIKYAVNKSLMVDEVLLGIGNSQVKLKYNKKDQEIAYKLWVELSTRKIGLDFDSENDVIFEVYDSWYDFFTTARELMEEIPAEILKYSSELIELTEAVLLRTFP